MGGFPPKVTPENIEALRKAPCGIRHENGRWSIWFGTVLIGYAATKESASLKLGMTMREALDDANKAVKREDDSRNYIIDNIDRIQREGADLTGKEIT